MEWRIYPSQEKDWSMSWTSQFPTPLIWIANEMEPTTDEPDCDCRYQSWLSYLMPNHSTLHAYSSLKLVSSSNSCTFQPTKYKIWILNKWKLDNEYPEGGFLLCGKRENWRRLRRKGWIRVNHEWSSVRAKAEMETVLDLTLLHGSVVTITWEWDSLCTIPWREAVDLLL